MSSVPRPPAPVPAAPHLTGPIAAEHRRDPKADRRPDPPASGGSPAGDPEAVLARAALRKLRIGRLRVAACAPAPAAYAVGRWDDEGGVPRRRT